MGQDGMPLREIFKWKNY